MESNTESCSWVIFCFIGDGGDSADEVVLESADSFIKPSNVQNTFTKHVDRRIIVMADRPPSQHRPATTVYNMKPHVPFAPRRCEWCNEGELYRIVRAVDITMYYKSSW